MDYMVRSKQFGIKPIPPMTNATTPSGIVSAYSVNSTNLEYYVFNGNYNDGLYWQSNPQSTSMAHLVWIQYEFPTAVCAKSIFWKAYRDNNTESPLQYRLAASNDGTNFVDLVSGSKIVGTDGEEFIIQFSNNTSYKFYRWYSSGGYYQNQFYANTRKLQLYYQDANIVDNERAMYFIGQNNYASDTLLADTDWLDAICNSQYMEYILNTKVPTMTDYTVPYGTVIESGHYNSFYGWHAFMDGGKDRTAAAESTAWYHNSSSKWVGYNFGKDVKIYRIETRYGHGGGSASSTIVCAVDCSTDGTTWEEIPSVTFSATIYGTNISSLLLNNTDVGCQAIRLRQVSGYGVMMTYLQFYGRTDIPDPSHEPSGYKALVPIMTSDTAPTGRAISSGYYASFYTYYAFDDSDNYWHSQDGASSTNVPWVGYKFDTAVMVTHLLIKNRSSGAIRTPIHPILQASNDGTVWYTIQEFTVTNFDNNGISEFDVNNDNYYLYYRLFGGLNNNNDYVFVLSRLQLYGYESAPDPYYIWKNDAIGQYHGIIDPKLNKNIYPSNPSGTNLGIINRSEQNGGKIYNLIDLPKYKWLVVYGGNGSTNQQLKLTIGDREYTWNANTDSVKYIDLTGLRETEFWVTSNSVVGNWNSILYIYATNVEPT